MKVKLQDILSPVQRKVEITSNEHYSVIGVKWYAKGIFIKDKKVGKEIKAKYLYEVKKGDFLYNRLFAWKGSFALSKEDNVYASNEFPMFVINKEKVTPEYLIYYFGQEQIWDQINDASKGVSSVSRKRFKEQDLMVMELELPTLEEQSKITEKISKFINSTEELDRRDRTLLSNLEQLLNNAFVATLDNANLQKMSEVAPIIRRAVSIEATKTYPEVGIRSFGKGTFHKPALSAKEVGTKRLYQIYEKDLLFSNVFAWEGAIAVAKSDDHGRYASHRFISCVCKEGIVDPYYLQFHFLTESGIRDIRGASPGSAGRNKTLGLNKLRSIKVPVPEYSKQQDFVKLLHIVNEIKSLVTSNNFLYEEMKGQVIHENIK